MKRMTVVIAMLIAVIGIGQVYSQESALQKTIKDHIDGLLTTNKQTKETIAVQYQKDFDKYVTFVDTNLQKSIETENTKVKEQLEKLKTRSKTDKDDYALILIDGAMKQVEESNPKLNIARPTDNNNPLKLDKLAITYKGHRYITVIASVKWDEAAKACQQAGGHLVCIETEDEWRFIKEITQGITVWVGGLLNEDKTQAKWINGALIDKTLWMTGRPLPGKNDIRYIIMHEKQLYDSYVSNNAAIGFVCEWDK